MAPRIYISPPGELLWPKLLEPGPLEKAKEGKVAKTGWSTDLLLPEADEATKGLKALIQDFFHAEHGQGKKPGQNGRPWKQFLGQDEQPTGMLIFRFKANQFFMARDIESGDPVRRSLPAPHVEDASGRPWPSGLLIGNSSIGKVAFTMYAWNGEEGGHGVSLGLKGARILVHVPYERPTAEGAFGDPEPGFTVATSSPFGTEPMREQDDLEWGALPRSDEDPPF